mmetsp:Transcript_67613/g.161808  ORF Transcript_67613/g.161808 Transcript_67613/m.161808 type:complete len:253 (+) Transcript_67613:200-958(+)
MGQRSRGGHEVLVPPLTADSVLEPSRMLEDCREQRWAYSAMDLMTRRRRWKSLVWTIGYASGFRSSAERLIWSCLMMPGTCAPTMASRWSRSMIASRSHVTFSSASRVRSNPSCWTRESTTGGERRRGSFFSTYRASTDLHSQVTSLRSERESTFENASSNFDSWRRPAREAASSARCRSVAASSSCCCCCCCCAAAAAAAALAAVAWAAWAAPCACAATGEVGRGMAATAAAFSSRAESLVVSASAAFCSF